MLLLALVLLQFTPAQAELSLQEKLYSFQALEVSIKAHFIGGTMEGFQYIVRCDQTECRTSDAHGTLKYYTSRCKDFNPKLNQICVVDGTFNVSDDGRLTDSKKNLYVGEIASFATPPESLIYQNKAMHFILENKIMTVQCDRNKCFTNHYRSVCTTFDPLASEVCIDGLIYTVRSNHLGHELLDPNTGLKISDLAVEEENLSADKILLAGKGTRRGNGSESLALACYIDSSCQYVRFIHFINNETVEWIGEPFQLTPLNSKAQRLEIQKYLVERGQVPPALIDSDKGAVFGPILVFIVTPLSYGLGSAIATGAAAVLSITFAPALIFIGASFLLIPKQAQFISNHRSDDMTLERGKDGWGWSQNPSRMNVKKFDRLIRIIKGEERVNYTMEQQDAMSRFDRKIDRALRKK